MTRYKGRHFLALDGESVSRKYVLLADSSGEAVENIDGLSSLECLDFLARRLPKSASWTRVGFGLNYDVNHWVRDLPPEDRIGLFRGDVVSYGGYQLRYVANRIFTIHRAGECLAQIYDCLGMFRCPFLDVADDWLGSEFPERELIAWGKQRREFFHRDDLEAVRRYNRAECDVLVRILERVRAFLLTVPGGGVDLRGWYGAGAIAASWLRRAGVRRLMRRFDDRYCGPDLLEAFARAYHGGRVEARVVGTVGPVYRYDLNSAYAWAASQMGRVNYHWLEQERFLPARSARMSLWHVHWRLPHGAPLGPFPVRDVQGRITYPLSGQGWYWWPEVKVARDLYGPRRVRVERGYLCPSGARPVGVKRANLADVLKTMYQFRHVTQYVHGNEPGARLLKLALASIWGKFAQRHSATNDDEPGYYFCLPWAGWITSCVRAAILHAIQRDGDAVVAIATDGIVTTRELAGLPISANLGGWSREVYERGTFLLPGLFRLHAYDGSEDVQKSRGFERVQLEWENLLDELHANGQAKVHVRRFIGHILPDLYPSPELEAMRLRFARIPITVKPAGILAKRVGGHELAERFDYRTQHVETSAHEGWPEFVSFGVPDDTLKHEVLKRNAADGEIVAQL